MKNVLLVIGSSLVNAGVPNVAMKMVRSLHGEYNFDIVVGSSEPGYYDEEFLSFGGDIFRYDKYVYEDGLIKFNRSGKQLYNVINEILSKKKYDVIHCQNGYLSGWALKAAFEHDISVRIAHSHGTYILRGKNIPARMFKKSSMKKICKYATYFFACSDIAGKTLFCGHDFENIMNPIDMDQYLSLQKKPHDSINLIQIGYYCKLKNQIFTLKVLQELVSKGKNAKLWYIGYDDGSGYMSDLTEKIREFDLDDRIQMLPPNYDKLLIFPEMDFLLLPSSSEGMPLTALEAQASRTYCIASTHVPSDVDMGLFKRMDVDALGSAEKCAEWIIQNCNYTDSLDVERIKQLNTAVWVKRIETVYGE